MDDLFTSVRLAIKMMSEIKAKEEERTKQFFIDHGRDYDSDILIINENLFPEYIFGGLPKRVILGPLPVDTAALFFKEMTLPKFDIMKEFKMRTQTTHNSATMPSEADSTVA